jgi:hypothetical protein
MRGGARCHFQVIEEERGLDIGICKMVTMALKKMGRHKNRVKNIDPGMGCGINHQQFILNSVAAKEVQLA